MNLDDLPILGVCGWSGAGKSTLLEAVVRHFAPTKARLLVVKRDVRGLDVDKPGKESDRLFRAGADVLLQAVLPRDDARLGTLLPVLEAVLRQRAAAAV